MTGKQWKEFYRLTGFAQLIKLERVANVGVERVVHTGVRTDTKLVVQTEGPSAVRGVDAERHVRILVAEGRDNGEVKRRSNVPAGNFEFTADRHTNRELEDVEIVNVGLVTGFERINRELRPTQTGMRHNVEGTGLGEKFTANADREGVGISRELSGKIRQKSG